MTDTQRVIQILFRIEALLKIGSTSNWGDNIERLRKEFLHDPQKGFFEIISIYGGMGSFNDVILYSNGKILIKENIEFDQLRSELYEICRCYN